MKNLKNPFLDTNSINIYAKSQVSRFNGVARMNEKPPKNSKILKIAIKWLKTKKLKFWKKGLEIFTIDRPKFKKGSFFAPVSTFIDVLIQYFGLKFFFISPNMCQKIKPIRLIEMSLYLKKYPIFMQLLHNEQKYSLQYCFIGQTLFV